MAPYRASVARRTRLAVVPPGGRGPRVQALHDRRDLARRLAVAGAAGRTRGRLADPDLQMRRGADAHRAAPDLGDRLAPVDVLAPLHQRRLSVAVVDVPALARPERDAHDRRLRPEARDALLDDLAVGDGDLDRLTAARPVDRRNVDPLVRRPGRGRQ